MNKNIVHVECNTRLIHKYNLELTFVVCFNAQGQTEFSKCITKFEHGWHGYCDTLIHHCITWKFTISKSTCFCSLIKPSMEISWQCSALYECLFLVGRTKNSLVWPYYNVKDSPGMQTLCFDSLGVVKPWSWPAGELGGGSTCTCPCCSGL